MSFSDEWERCYQQSTHMSIWPWSDLVSLIMEHKPNQDKVKVLELGCGAGANIPLFASLGFEYHAVEGSKTIVEQLHKQYPQFAQNIYVGDFTKNIPNEKFDLIVDRASLTCNDEHSISKCLTRCYASLVSGGKFIGVDWYSTQSSEYVQGQEAGDCWTRTNLAQNGFANTGEVHFSDQEHLEDLFHQFTMQSIFHKVLVQEVPQRGWRLATWNFVAKKYE